MQHASFCYYYCLYLSKSENQCRDVTEVFVLGVILAEGPQHYKKAVRVEHCKKGSLIQVIDVPIIFTTRLHHEFVIPV